MEAVIYKRLLSNPGLLEELIPIGYNEYVILDEVHRLIESRGIKFLLTGSSARKLRGRGVILLAGRALLNYMHPLTAKEMGADFELKCAIKTGMLPGAQSDAYEQYLHSYAQVYLEQEVQQEGLW